jgi:predicted NBD/HSP70 family sugar kinase
MVGRQRAVDVDIVVSPTKGREIADSPISDVAGRRRGVAAEELRRHNLSAVLDRIHSSGPLSRSQLASQTGLNRSTIRDLINELSELGLVIEDRGATGQGPGRPSSVARPSPRGAVVLAVELEVDSMALATVGLGGHIFGKVRVPHPAGGIGAPETTVAALARLAPPLLDGLPSGHHLVGVGAGVAGVVRRSDGFVHVAPNLGWTETPLGEMLGAELGMERVMLANEADMGALGELRRGAARQSRHLIFIAGEVGVGVGIILDGKPMLGSAGYAGEAGHMIVHPSGRLCRCGSTGCWETEAGEEALLLRAGFDGTRDGDRTLEEIVTRAQERDERTLTALAETGHWLGVGIGNLINTFNPDLVVLGGFFQVLYPYLGDSVRAAAETVALGAPWQATEIKRGELGDDAQLIGAAEMVLAEVIGDPTTFRPDTPAIPTA